MLLPDATAIVTGGASGIGRSIARTIADHGADVVIADIQEHPRDDTDATPTHRLIDEETESTATFVDCDVSVPADVKQAVDAAGELGELDVLINNAGIFNPGNFFETTPEEYDRTQEVNAKSMYFASQQAAIEMAETGGGSIVNISSIAGALGNKRYVKYTMSKGAVRMLTYSLADYLGEHDIRVNAVHPGTINTSIVEDDDENLRRAEKLIPSGRVGQPDEVAKAVLFLASDLASYVNGESILVDGGYTNTGSPRWDVKDL